MFGWSKKSPVSASPKTVGDVMSAYGALIEKYPLTIMDISMLPISKTQMKVVLKGLYAQASSPEKESWIETAFMFLSKFQDGVGPTPIEGEMLGGDANGNLQANMAMLEKWLGWEKLSLAEAEVLLAEWKRFKTGEPI